MLPADTLVAEAARTQTRIHLPKPREPAGRHVRRADDGEPVVRPLPRLDAQRRRAPGGPELRRHGGGLARHPSADPRLAGLRPPGPRPLVGRRARADERREDGRLPEDRQRRVRGRLLRRGRPGVHPGRGEGVHHLRSLPLLADGLDAAQPRVHARGPVLRAARQRPAAADRGAQVRLPVGDDDLARARPARHLAPLLLRRRAGHGAVGPGRDSRSPRRSTSTTRAARAARCRTSRSSTRSSPAARARARAPPATSTRTATCAWARRSWPTSCTRSWSRRSSRRGALFVVYDEWGGFYDHVVPPTRARRPATAATSTRTTA